MGQFIARGFLAPFSIVPPSNFWTCTSRLYPREVCATLVILPSSGIRKGAVPLHLCSWTHIGDIRCVCCVLRVRHKRCSLQTTYRQREWMTYHESQVQCVFNRDIFEAAAKVAPESTTAQCPRVPDDGFQTTREGYSWS